ncbi:MAG: class II aldolase/adducin family protein [Planctomycetia bacterium]|nr:class II aldolase/adducin family protein [Planctomycetia bacterium]
MTHSHSPDEQRLRIDLAACYRLVALYGWDDIIFTHISVKLPGKAEFLINPYGMLFDEITASSLVRVDEVGNKLSESPHPVNPAGFVIHSAIHAVRHDALCVLHTHTVAGVAVSAQREGLLPISQQATVALASLGYHDYEGIAVRDDEKARLQRDLGDKTCLILRNHGLLTVGSTIADAFLSMYLLQRACEIQLLAQAGGELVSVDSRIIGGVKENVMAVTRGLGGSLAWPGLLRKLDRLNPGYAD